MKDFSQEALEAAIDGGDWISAREKLDFCLQRLYEDKEKTISDTVCSGLIFEELIGALIDAKRCVEMLEADES